MSKLVTVATYEDVAPLYSTSAEFILLRPFVEQPSLLRVLGDVEGKAVLDLACGDGYYTRLLKKLGAARAVGVDISARMIEAARRVEATDPLGVEYLVHDAALLPILGSSDVITAVWLLVYAQSREHLRAMCQRIYDNLKPGGRLVAYTLSPDFDTQGPNPTKYGYSLHYPESPSDGCEITFVVHSHPPVTMSCRCWSRQAIEQALTVAGFRDTAWTPASVAEEGLRRYGTAFWQDYITNPDGVVLSSRR